MAPKIRRGESSSTSRRVLPQASRSRGGHLVTILTARSNSRKVQTGLILRRKLARCPRGRKRLPIARTHLISIILQSSRACSRTSSMPTGSGMILYGAAGLNSGIDFKPSSDYLLCVILLPTAVPVAGSTHEGMNVS